MTERESDKDPNNLHTEKIVGQKQEAYKGTVVTSKWKLRAELMVGGHASPCEQCHRGGESVNKGRDAARRRGWGGGARRSPCPGPAEDSGSSLSPFHKTDGLLALRSYHGLWGYSEISSARDVIRRQKGTG